MRRIVSDAGAPQGARRGRRGPSAVAAGTTPSPESEAEPRPPAQVVVIAGRPNAGKSTLFNRLLGRRHAIVHPTPGITRDENRVWLDVGGRSIELVDTGGIEEHASGRGLAERVQQKSLDALARADAIIYLLDGQAGLSPADASVARHIRQLGIPTVFAVNKIDRPSHETRLLDFAELGEAELVPVSAAHGGGVGELLERVVAGLPGPPEGRVSAPLDDPGGPGLTGDVPAESADDGAGAGHPADDADLERPPRIALIGRPNVGKSSLLNRLAGHERALVDATPGTTRDPVDIELERAGRHYVVVDTAGLRRPSRIAEEVESFAAQASLRAIARADVVVLVIDATEGVTDQDLRLADLVWRRGRGLVVAVNKIDLAPDLTTDQCHATIAARLPLWPPVALVRLSALSGTGMRSLFAAIDQVVAAYRRRFATARLNALLAAAVAVHDPPLAHGRAVKLFYATQTGVAPPAIAVFASHAESIPASYRRYLTNSLRSSLELVGVPLRLVFRSRRREERPRRRARPSPVKAPTRGDRPAGSVARTPRRLRDRPR